METHNRRSNAASVRLRFAGICVFCGLAAAALVQWGPVWLRRAELGFARAVVNWGKKSEVRDDIVFVGLDDISANLLTKSGLSEKEIAASDALDLMSYGMDLDRRVWGFLCERLIEAGARVVVYDLLFIKEKGEDLDLKEQLDRYRDQVVIGGELFELRENEAAVTASFKEPAQTVLSPGGVADPRLGSVAFFPREDERVWDATFDQLVALVPGSPEYRSLAARALEQIGEAEKLPATGEAGIRYPEYFPRSRDAARPYEPIPLYTIFFKDTWEKNYGSGEFFKGKIVVVGDATNVEGRRDIGLTPVGTIRGPQLHIAVIANALNGDFFRWAPGALNIAMVLLAALGTFLVAGLSRRPVPGVLAMFGVGLLYVLGAILVYNNGLMLNGIAPLSTLLVSGMLCFGVQFSMERRDKLRLKRALDRYVSRDVSDELLAHPDEFLDALGGRRLIVTVLFSDLRGFTAKSENADERELVAQLNEYLEAMVACVFEHGGMVDKFIGDAVMAVWGAIREEGEEADARAAVASALDMRRRLAELNVKWEAEGRQTHAFGIGINQGPAVFGNIGSADKMELTVIGDAVNLASRLESLTKKFGTDLLIGGSVARQLGGGWVVRPIDEVVVKGKTSAVEISTVLGRQSDELDAAELEFLERFKEAHVAWREADPARAEELFRHCAELRPEDQSVQIYLERLVEVGGDPEKMRGPLWVAEK